MRIAVDASRAARPRRTGTEAYSHLLIDALASSARGHRFELYYDREPVDAPTGSHVRKHVVPLPRLWTHARLSLEMVRARPDVLFVPSHVLPLVRPRASVVTIHDLGYLRYRLAYSPAAWTYLLLSTLWNARVATRIVVDSWATQRDLVQHTGVEPERVHVVHLGVEPRFRPVPPPIEPGYLLFLGTHQPRKNLPRLLRAYARAGPLPPLVLAGSAGHRSDQVEREIARLGIGERVRRLGYVDADQLPGLYSGALAFVFPSLFEGFGLPLLEAMACGTPTLAGANSSMPEIVGDAGLLVDATDEEAIARALRTLADDAALRQRLRDAGFARASAFTWERAAEQTLDVLELAARRA